MPFAKSSEIAPIGVLSDQIRILLKSRNSSSRMSAMVVDVPPGGFVPPHSHALEEEGYFVLEGALDLTVGDRVETLPSGGFGHVPPGTLHAYANRTSEPVRFLAWTVGGPIDEFFEAMSRSVKEMPRDAAVMEEIATRFGVTMAGPPN